MTDSAIKPQTPFLARAAGVVLAVGALGLMLWTFRLMSVESRFRRLPVLTAADEGGDAQRVKGIADELGRLAQADPNNGDVLNAYASVLGSQRRNRDALEQLGRARKIQNSQNSLFFLAEMYERLKLGEQAEAALGDCIVINPSNTQYNQAWIRLLFNRMQAAEDALKTGKIRGRAPYDEARRRYAEAARDWAVRAPHDFNSYLFLANYHISQMRAASPQYYLVQAYRLLLQGLSGQPWMDLTKTYYVQPQLALRTIRQILDNHYAKPYKGLP